MGSRRSGNQEPNLDGEPQLGYLEVLQQVLHTLQFRQACKTKRPHMRRNMYHRTKATEGT